MLGKDLTISPKPWGKLEWVSDLSQANYNPLCQLRTQEGTVGIWLIWVGSQLLIKRRLEGKYFAP